MNDNSDPGTASRTSGFSAALTLGQRAMIVINMAASNGNSANARLNQAQLPMVCVLSIGGYGVFQRPGFHSSTCKRGRFGSLGVNLARITAHKAYGSLKASLANTWAEEWFHFLQGKHTPIYTEVKSHCFFALRTRVGFSPASPVPAGAPLKHQLAYDAMTHARDVELQFTEAEANLQKLCNFWRSCSRKNTPAAGSITGAKKTDKKKALKKICANFESACKSLQQSMDELDQVLSDFQDACPSCANGSGNDCVAKDVMLIKQSGSTQNVGDINVTMLHALAEAYADEKGMSKDDAENDTGADTGMVKEFNDKKEQIKQAFGAC